MKVFVTGGSGYIGEKLLHSLVEAGMEVTALIRPGTRRPLSQAGVQGVEGDLQDLGALKRGSEGQDAVIHLVGILRESPRHGTTFQKIHVEGTRAVLQAAREAGVARYLHMSALGAGPEAEGGYFTSKWTAEELVRSSPVPWTIFRPSLVFGAGGPGPNFLKTLKEDLLSLPLHPVFGGGTQLLQPVALETVASAFVNALSRPVGGETFSLAGPDVLTFKEVLGRLADATGRPFHPVSVPTGVMGALLPVLESLPGFPLTRDQFRMLLQGSTAPDWRRAHEVLGLTPIPFSVTGL